uniref:Uncharacterized protein n=1 Tax=Arundo donax TaxID=35708 RepID=A0A0A9BE65_ARUDO
MFCNSGCSRWQVGPVPFKSDSSCKVESRKLLGAPSRSHLNH